MMSMHFEGLMQFMWHNQDPSDAKKLPFSLVFFYLLNMALKTGSACITPCFHEK
jgi:hypothetical protein